MSANGPSHGHLREQGEAKERSSRLRARVTADAKWISND
jgi:hypothetical protein